MHPCVLFLCTGNYYRSRFAEALFERRAEQAGLDWRATSRGLALTADNVGPISLYALRRLTDLGIETGQPRFPRPATPDDLARARRVVALDDVEHRGLVERLFPESAAAVEYWNVADRDPTAERDPLQEVEHRVDALVARIHGRLDSR